MSSSSSGVDILGVNGGDLGVEGAVPDFEPPESTGLTDAEAAAAVDDDEAAADDLVGLMRGSRYTAMFSTLKVFQFGLGCLRMNLKAVTSCKDTRLSEAGMMIRSCEPDSV